MLKQYNQHPIAESCLILQLSKQTQVLLPGSPRDWFTEVPFTKERALTSIPPHKDATKAEFLLHL